MIKASELTKTHYRTGEMAKLMGLSARTIGNKCNSGEITNFYRQGSHRFIAKEEVIKHLVAKGLFVDDTATERRDVLYARVSTHKQKTSGDLARQVEMISNYAITQSPVRLEIVQEVASGLNDQRKGLNALLQAVMNGEVHRIFISHKDRLTRFGFHYIETICSQFNTTIVIVSAAEQEKSLESELAEDIISVVHSFSGRLYGMRSRVKKAVDKELQSDE